MTEPGVPVSPPSERETEWNEETEEAGACLPRPFGAVSSLRRGGYTCCGSTVKESDLLLGSGNVGGFGETEVEADGSRAAKRLNATPLPFVSLLAEIFFGGIGGADLDFGGTVSSSWIKGAVVFVAGRVLVGRSDMSFLLGGSGRVLMEAAGEGGGCHRLGEIPICPVPFPVTEPTFGPSTSTTQSLRSSKLVFRPRLGGDGEGECASLPLNECTLFSGLGVGMDLAVGEIGSSKTLAASPGASASSTSSPKSFRIFDFGRGDFWSLRASKAVILDWMDVEGDMINYVSGKSCRPRLPKSCTPSQVTRTKCTFKAHCLCRLQTFALSQSEPALTLPYAIGSRFGGADPDPLPEQVAEYIAECQRVLEKSGLKYKARIDPTLSLFMPR